MAGTGDGAGAISAAAGAIAAGSAAGATAGADAAGVVAGDGSTGSGGIAGIELGVAQPLRIAGRLGHTGLARFAPGAMGVGFEPAASSIGACSLVVGGSLGLLGPPGVGGWVSSRFSPATGIVCAHGGEGFGLSVLGGWVQAPASAGSERVFAHEGGAFGIGTAGMGSVSTGRADASGAVACLRMASSSADGASDSWIVLAQARAGAGEVGAGGTVAIFGGGVQPASGSTAIGGAGVSDAQLLSLPGVGTDHASTSAWSSGGGEGASGGQTGSKSSEGVPGGVSPVSPVCADSGGQTGAASDDDSAGGFGSALGTGA